MRLRGRVDVDVYCLRHTLVTPRDTLPFAFNALLSTISYMLCLPARQVRFEVDMGPAFRDVTCMAVKPYPTLFTGGVYIEAGFH